MISARRRQLGPERREALDGAELEDALAAADHRARAHHVHELARVARVGERVELLAAREQLVRLVRSGVEADLDELDVQLRLALVQRGAIEHARVHDLARLRREPAPRGDELDQSFLSWNQKKPLGARVSRYGSSPILGKRVRPNISSGTRPANRDRSSSTACAERATLCTHRTMSSS